MIINNNGNFNNNGVIGSNNIFTNYGNIDSKVQSDINKKIDEIISQLKKDNIAPEPIKSLVEENLNKIKTEKNSSNLESIFNTIKALGSVITWLPEKINTLFDLFKGA